MPYYVYATSKDEDKVSIFTLDAQSGELERVDDVEVKGGPGPLATHPKWDVLYVGQRYSYELSTYSIDRHGSISCIGTVSLESDPNYLVTDRRGNFLLSAYYLAGKVAVHPIASNGVATSPPTEWLSTGLGAHSVQTDRSNRYVLASHVAGPDRPNAVFQFRFDESTGRITPQVPAKVTALEGAGPRHLYFHPSKDIVYCSNEQGSSVSAFSFAPSRGTLSPIETVATVPDGYEGENMCSGIEVAPSGKFLYVGNRGYNSIACFSLDTMTGGLTLIGQVPTDPIPHGFSRDPEGNFLLVTSLETGRLSVYRIDQDRGDLKPLAVYPLGKYPMWAIVVRVGE